MSDPLASLVKKIEQKLNEAAGKHPRKLGVFVIVPDAPGRAEHLRSLAWLESLQRVNLSIGVAPPKYEVNPHADVTVVVYNPDRPGRQTVQANFVLRKDGLDGPMSDVIVAAVAKVLPK